MIYIVENKELKIGSVQIGGISSSSVLLIGDTQVIKCSSIFDTPPESFVVGPLVPLAPER